MGASSASTRAERPTTTFPRHTLRLPSWATLGFSWQEIAASVRTRCVRLRARGVGIREKEACIGYRTTRVEHPATTAAAAAAETTGVKEAARVESLETYARRHVVWARSELQHVTRPHVHDLTCDFQGWVDPTHTIHTHRREKGVILYL